MKSDWLRLLLLGAAHSSWVPEYPAVIAPPTRHTTTNGISKCHDILIIASLTAVCPARQHRRTVIAAQKCNVRQHSLIISRIQQSPTLFAASLFNFDKGRNC